MLLHIFHSRRTHVHSDIVCLKPHLRFVCFSSYKENTHTHTHPKSVLTLWTKHALHVCVKVVLDLAK